jgi:Na+-driven multidrug efflux pump
MMLVLTLIARIWPEELMRPFSSDAGVIAFGGEYMLIVSLNFLASGIAFSSSSVFQGLGNTIPPLLSTASRLVLFALPALWLARQAGFEIRQVWYLSVASQLVQAILILVLLRRELTMKLRFS